MMYTPAPVSLPMAVLPVTPCRRFALFLGTFLELFLPSSRKLAEVSQKKLFLDPLEGVLRQQALPAVSCCESEEAMLVQEEGFTNTTWIWIKAMSGETHWLLPSVSHERDWPSSISTLSP